MNLNFTPFPTLTTSRLTLRQMKITDATALFQLRSHPLVYQYLENYAPESVETMEKFTQLINQNIEENKSIMWVISLQNSPDLVGTICFWNINHDKEKADIGYELHPEFHRKGIMQEAISAVLKHGFEVINFATIEAMTHQKNTASIQLLERNYFKKEIRDATQMKDCPKNNSLFCLQKTNFLPINR